MKENNSISSIIYFFDDNISILQTKRPHKNVAGEWVVDLGTNCVVKSIKNCVYVDQDDSLYLFVLKHDDNSLNLDYSP